MARVGVLRDFGRDWKLSPQYRLSREQSIITIIIIIRSH